MRLMNLLQILLGLISGLTNLSCSRSLLNNTTTFDEFVRMLVEFDEFVGELGELGDVNFPENDGRFTMSSPISRMTTEDNLERASQSNGQARPSARPPTMPTSSSSSSSSSGVPRKTAFVVARHFDRSDSVLTEDNASTDDSGEEREMTLVPATWRIRECKGI